jgi:hypothetical protein
MLVHASRRFLGARRGLADYGLAVDRRWLVDLTAGLGIGLAGLAIPYLIGIGAGWLEVVAVFDRGQLALWPGIALIVFSMFWVGLWEELLLRAVFICNAADGLRKWLSPRRAVAGGIVVSAVVFGVAHLAQAAQAALVLTWVLSGVVLGVIYVLSGNLALTIGIHAAFNIAYNVLFVRTDVAGTEALSAITRVGVDPTLPFLVSGGALEAGAWITVGLLALLWLSYSRRLFVDLEALEVGDEDASKPTPTLPPTGAIRSRVPLRQGGVIDLPPHIDDSRSAVAAGDAPPMRPADSPVIAVAVSPRICGYMERAVRDSNPRRSDP